MIRTAILLLFVAITAIVVSTPPQVAAQAVSCTYEGQCVSNKRCVCPPGAGGCYVSNADCGSALVGGVAPPKGVAEYNQASGGEIGIILFASRIIFVLNIAAGLFVIFNVVVAGLTYVTSLGDTAAHEKVRDKLMYSIIGLAVIVSSYTIGAIVGMVFFGDAAYVLRPSLQGAL